MILKQDFLENCYLSEEDLTEANITWEELEQISEAYENLEDHLRNLGKNFIDEYLYDIDKAGIHSYRYRTKSPGHLLEKIIRKRKENPEKFRSLDHTNFSCTAKTGFIFINTLQLFLKITLKIISKNVWPTLTMIQIIFILLSVQKFTNVLAILIFMMLT